MLPFEAMLWMPSQARLSLVTFFAKTKKAAGRAALKRAAERGQRQRVRG